MTEHPPPAADAATDAATDAAAPGPRPSSESSDGRPGRAARTGVHRTGVHRAPRSRRRTVLLVVAAVVVLAVVVGAVALLVRPEGGGTSTTGPGSTADGALAGVAADVAEWVDAELPADVPVTASGEVGAALASALAAAGAAEGRLTDERAGALQVVVGDPAPDAVVVARFHADDGTLVNVVDPRPAEPTTDELQRRKGLAGAVLANPMAGATGQVAEVLRTADIDARLLGLVAVLVARLDAGIAEFPRAPGQPEQGTPARRVLVGSIGGQELRPGSAATERVRAFVAAQQPPFAPDTVEVTEQGLLVGFDYVPSPDAEVTAATR